MMRGWVLGKRVCWAAQRQKNELSFVEREKFEWNITQPIESEGRGVLEVSITRSGCAIYWDL